MIIAYLYNDISSHQPGYVRRCGGSSGGCGLGSPTGQHPGVGPRNCGAAHHGGLGFSAPKKGELRWEKPRKSLGKTNGWFIWTWWKSDVSSSRSSGFSMFLIIRMSNSHIHATFADIPGCHDVYRVEGVKLNQHTTWREVFVYYLVAMNIHIFC